MSSPNLNNKDNNQEDEHDGLKEAVDFITNYTESKENGARLAVDDIEETLDNLVTLSSFLLKAVHKLVSIYYEEQDNTKNQDTNYRPLTNMNLDGNLDDTLRRLYS